jgi:hypothetical protein
MKKKITSTLVLMMVVFTSIFASPNPANVSRKVQSAFTEKFSDARNVSWTNHEKYIKANFTIDEQSMFAIFSVQGEFMGTGKNIQARHLPAKLQAQLEKKLPGGLISEVLEYGTEDESTYYASIENTEQTLYLKSLGFCTWEVIRTVKK